MRRSSNRTVLTDAVARFQDEVQALALAVIRALVEQEIDRKRAKLAPAKLPARTRRRSEPVATPPPPASTTAATVKPAAQPGSTSGATTGAMSGTTTGATGGATTGGKKRTVWTRESIVNELATWMLSGTSIDATFVKRHGPPGLVAATRRVFGRFDAALNVAALHLSKLYPDGPPGRNAQ